MLFLFVHCFVINMVNGLRSFLRKVLGLFYVKIHVLAHKSNQICRPPPWTSKNVQNLTPTYAGAGPLSLGCWGVTFVQDT